MEKSTQNTLILTKQCIPVSQRVVVAWKKGRKSNESMKQKKNQKKKKKDQ